jgi:hypothetical protein
MVCALSDKRICSLVFLIVVYMKFKSSGHAQYNAVLCSTVKYSTQERSEDFVVGGWGEVYGTKLPDF